VRLRGRQASPRQRLFTLLALLAALSLLIPAAAIGHHRPDHPQGPPITPEGKPVTIQFLNVSDWHGQIDSLDIFGVGLRGGASVISTYWQQDRLAHAGPTLSLTAGDDFGATPPISNFFDEVPAVLAQRMMGIQIGTLGNHNFDRGIDHLQQMIDLAGAPTTAQPGNPYVYVSANLENRDDDLTGVEDYKIFDLGGIKVGVVGITNPEAPELVFPGSFGTIVPTASAPAAMAAQDAARADGAQVVVALIHAGVRGFANGQPFGELIDFAEAVSGFDVIFGDHTDVQFSGVINGQLVQENRSKGRTYSRTFLTYQPKAGKVTDRWIDFVDPICNAINSATGACTSTPLGAPDPALEAMLDPFREELIPILSEVIGESTVAIPHSDKCGTGNGRTCESLIGNTITDAMRETYGTDFAITNSGGIRQPLTCPPEGGGGGFCPPFTPPPYPITVGQVLFVLPFGNQSVTIDLTGAQFKSMLENGVSVTGAQGRFPQVSGLCFTYDLDLAAGNRVTSAVFQAGDGSCTGAPLDLTSATTYSVTTNDFVASGGDGYPNFSALMVTRDIMANDVIAWIASKSPIAPEIQNRITCTGTGCPTVLP
jgi:2',3'-cyclic-nucleotide 2'-phosphodiesterase (5'-nucleotidase family)